jgi:GTP-binding protein HflX
VVLVIPYAQGGLVDTLHSGAKVLRTDYTGEGIEMEVILDDILYGRLKNYVCREC